MTNNIFREPEQGFVAHTAESSLLMKQQTIRDCVGYSTEDAFPASAKFIEATERWGTSEANNHTAYNIAFNTQLPMFEDFSLSPNRAKRFANTMVDMADADGYHVRHLVNGFSWDGLEAGSVVVDVSLSFLWH